MKHGYPVGHPKHNSTANIASVSVNNATLHALMVSNKVGNLTNNVAKVNNVSDWLIDSGASMHLCNNRRYFGNDTFKVLHDRNVVLGNNETIKVVGMGDVPVRITLSNGRILMYSNNHKQSSTSNRVDVVIKDVLYVPDIAANLLSVAKITAHGAKVMFNGNECNLVGRSGEYIASAYKHANSNLYRLNVQPLHAMYVGNVGHVGNVGNVVSKVINMINNNN